MGERVKHSYHFLGWTMAMGTLVLIMTLLGSTLVESSQPTFEPLPVPLPQTAEYYNSNYYAYNIKHERRRRDLTGDVLDAAGSLGVGEKYIKKFRTLVEGVPPKMQDALINQDFSNVTQDDIRRLNITVIEYLPPKILKKLNSTLLSVVIEKLLDSNKPVAMGRVMTVLGDKMDSNQLLDKLKQSGGITDKTEEAGSVLLYTALNKVGDSGGLDQRMIHRLTSEGLLSLVPEEQLMKVTDPDAAKELMSRLYGKATGAQGDSDLKDLDDQALIYKLAEKGYGKAETWGSNTIRELSQNSRVVPLLPAEFLKELNPKTVSDSISQLRETKWESSLQAKSIADVFLQGKEGREDQAIRELGKLAAFVSPSKGPSNSKGFLSSILEGCQELGLPAPLASVAGLLPKKPVDKLRYEDFRDLSGSILRNSPPEVVAKSMDTRALNERQLADIAGKEEKKGFFAHPFFQGIIAQVSSYAVQLFTRGGRIDLRGIPGAFLGALGITGIRGMSNRDLNDDLVSKLRDNPDALDDAQKAMLLKRLKDEGLLDSTDLPPEIRNLIPRKGKDQPPNPDVLKGLPSDSELRLAYGYGRKLTATDLEKDPLLVGTLTPKQVMDMELEQIPAVLAVVRKSKDGPGQQTLQELSRRFGEYIRAKSEDYEIEDKKLLKYVTAAEVNKLPATVLAYFIDHKQTAKLPPEVRKEIMIAMGELSTKDHAQIPGKTREEIILQGLAAIDKLTGGSSSKKLDVQEVAAVGVGVADLSPSRIDQLTPVAAEQALEVIKGLADDDDDGLRIRACLSSEQRSAWRKKVIQIWGSPANWDEPTVASLCCVVPLLDKKDVSGMSAKALATCRCPSDSKPPSHLQELKKALEANCRHDKGDSAVDNKSVEKARADLVFDLDDLESQIIAGRRRKRSTDKLTCFKVRMAGSAALFTKEQLESLDGTEMDDCLYELGVDPLPIEHSRILWGKLVESRKESGDLAKDDVRVAGHILAGIKLSDAGQLNFRDWDMVLPFGKTTGLSKNVWEKMATNLEEKMKRPLSTFDTNDLVVTRNILCGFSPDKLNEIRSDAFRDALPVLKSLDPGCEQTRLAALAVITMRPEIFGDTAKWGPAEVRGVGILLSGLPLRTVPTLPSDSFAGVTSTVAAALPSRFLQALTPDQVANIPMFSAQAMSEEQRDALQGEAQGKLVLSGPQVSFAPTNSPQCLISLFILPLLALTVLY